MKHWLIPAAWGAAAYLGLNVALAAWVHHAFAGRPDGPLLISAKFGVPGGEAARGVRPVLPEEIPGWDGQFYFHVANDPLGTGDAAGHLDGVTYRYQRVGVPALAWAAARLTGHDWTPPAAYHRVQLLLVAVGFAGMVGWLRHHGASPLWAACWLLGMGVPFTLMFGLPDAPAEAVFALSLMALARRRLGCYVALMTLLVLIREGYAVVAAAAWLATALGKVTWPPASRRPASVLTAVPGIVGVAWGLYLARHFGVDPLSAERSPAGLYGWPFAAVWESFSDAGGLVGHLSLCLVTLVAALGRSARAARSSAAAACGLPLLALTACLGPIVWSAPEGYMKAVGPAVVLLIVLLPRGRAGWVKGVLIANLIAGLHWNVVRNVTVAPWYHPDVMLVGSPPAAAADVPHRDAVVEIVSPGGLRPDYQGVWRFLHRGVVAVRVRVTNAGPAALPGDVQVGVILWRGREPEWTRRVPLGEPLPPGASRGFDIPVRAGRPGPRTLQASLYDAAGGWWVQRDPSAGAAGPARVR